MNTNANNAPMATIHTYVRPDDEQLRAATPQADTQRRDAPERRDETEDDPRGTERSVHRSYGRVRSARGRDSVPCTRPSA